MPLQQITYQNKTNNRPILDRNKQATAEDFNEIKTVVNAISQEVNLISFVDKRHVAKIGGGTDLMWKKLASISFSTGLYSAAGFDLLIIDPSSNYGHSGNIDKYYYKITCRRSGGTLNNYDDAYVYGNLNRFVRIVKTSIGNYEIQVRTELNYRRLIVYLNKLDSNYATITYHNLTEDGSTVGTVYEVDTTDTGSVDNLLNINTNQITCVNLNETSDKRFKENVEIIDGDWALAVFKKLRFCLYDNSLSNRKDAGLIAQEVEKIIPEAVSTDINGKKSLNYRYVNIIQSAAIQHFIKTQLL